MQPVSTFRLYTLRFGYFILAAGLGTYVWPDVFRHSVPYAVSFGVPTSLLSAIGLLAVLGLRYPVAMIPLLLFELLWKIIYLCGFVLPLWRTGQLPLSMQRTAGQCFPVVIFLALIPWTYVIHTYVLAHGDRWRPRQ